MRSANRHVLAVTCSVFLLLAGLTFAQPVTIQLKHGTDAERRTKEELERILASYDLSKYTFTHEVVIDDKAIPHSHPVLTLHTRHLGSVKEKLGSFVAPADRVTDDEGASVTEMPQQEAA